MGIDRRLFSRLQFSEAGFAGFPYEPVRSENVKNSYYDCKCQNTEIRAVDGNNEKRGVKT